MLIFFRSIISFLAVSAIVCHSGQTGIFSQSTAAYAAETHPYKDNLRKAEASYQEGRYEEAVELWNGILAVSPGNKEAEEGIKNAQKKMGKIKKFFNRNVFETTAGIDKFSLEDCINVAEERSISVRAAREQIGLNKMKVWEARRAFLPQLKLSWNETKGIQSGGKTESIEYGVEGKQPAFHSGELIYSLAQAKANLKIAEKYYDNVKSELSYEVAKAFYSFIKAKKILEFAHALSTDVKPFHEIARKKRENDVISDIEYLNVESQANQIYFKGVSAESDFKLAKLALLQEMNIEDGSDIDVALGELPQGVDKDVSDCIALAMDNRPDLKVAEFTLKSSEYGKRIEQSKEMPRVDIAGNYKKFSEVYRDPYGLNTAQSLDPHQKWYAGLEVVWPFLGSTGKYSLYKKKDPPTLTTFSPPSESIGTSWEVGVLDNLKQLSTTKESEIRQIQAEEELNKARKKVITEVKEAFYGYEKARIQLDAAQAQKEFLEKEVQIRKARNEMGESESSELFESFTRLLDAAENYFTAEMNLSTSIAALNKAIGLAGFF